MSYYASYYRCALQMNPYCYAAYRGETATNESTYNNDILTKCKECKIDVVGLANHGNADSSESLRKKLQENGIIVFPGFEIMSAEKIHMACLFPEEKNVSELNRYLGALGLGAVVIGNETSSKTCLQIAEEIKKLGGFWYAAHITSDNGILKLGKMHDIWKNDLLVAAQIPDSKDNIDPQYKNIFNNTDPQYKRTKLPAFINACDIDKPEDLERDTATTLIKMTEPTFSNFLMAFKDYESRIRLNSEIEKEYQSCLKKISVTGGYLDGFEVDLSDNLIAIIGGRGTGKSTIVNLIRYTLNLSPVNKERSREFDEMIAHNLGSSSRVELLLSSNARYGQIFKIIRRFKAEPVIEDENGNISKLQIHDILPSIEIYGQNEIVDAVRDPELVTGIVKRLFKVDTSLMTHIEETYQALCENNKCIKELEDAVEMDESEISDLPALKERLHFYQEAGLESKLGLITKTTTQEATFEEFYRQISAIDIQFPKMSFCAEDEALGRLNSLVTEFNQKIEELAQQYEESKNWLVGQYHEIKGQWDKRKTEYDDEIKSSLKQVQGIQDKSSAEIVSDYTGLLKKVHAAAPIQSRTEQRIKQIEVLNNERKKIIESCRKCWDEYTTNITRQLKTLNKKKLKNIVRLSVKFRQQKNILLQRLKKIDGIGDKSVAGIEQYSDFDVFTFSDDVRKGADCLKDKYLLTPSTAEKIAKALGDADLREIELEILPDLYIIELFVNGQYKTMENLSKGQQCTAILNILLLDNKDPLIIDQPEDNLDNSFIADNLITTIRENKIKRQYIFATHNANIPVFGDAELIIAMEEVEGQGKISEGGIGSIDSYRVKDRVITILEGGEAAFKMREAKYGL